MPSYSQGQRLMTVTTPLGPDVLLLTGFTGTEELSHLYSFKLDLIADNKRKAEVAFDKLLGREITVETGLLGSARHYSGICVDIEQGDQDETFTSYRVEIVPKLWLLTRRAQSRIFQHLDVPQILKKVFDGIEYEQSFARVHEVREYCVQYRESDFDFASRLMEEEGIFYFFKHTKDGHKLILTDKPGYPSVPGQAAVPYAVSEGSRPMLRVHKWSKRQRLRSGKVALWDSSFHLPGKNLEAVRATIPDVTVGSVTHKLNVANSNLELYDYPGEYAKRFDGISASGGDQPDRLAKVHEDNIRAARIRMEAEAAQALVIEGISNCPHFTTGHKFKLERHFDAAGDYVIKSITHRATSGVAYRSGEAAEFSYENTFTCLPAQFEFRSPRKTPKPIVHGVQTAFVVGPANEEIYIDKHARVKVQFHWDREGQRNESSSCWVRVSQAWGGNNFGGMAVPRIGQEVIVEFEEGDPDRPIVNGRVYNAGAMPYGSKAGQPELARVQEKRQQAATQTKAVIAPPSRAGGGGGGGAPASAAIPILTSVISAVAGASIAPLLAKLGKTFIPKAANPAQAIIPSGMMTTIKSNSLGGSGGSNEITLSDIPGGESLFIKAERDMIVSVNHDYTTTVDHDMVVDIAGDRHTMIKGKDTLNVSKESETTVGGRYSLTVSKSAVIKIMAVEQHNVGGNYELTVGRDAVTTVKKDAKTNITGNESTEVAKDSSFRVGGNRTVEVLKDRTTTIKGDDKLTVEKTETVEVTDKIKVTGKKTIEVEAADEIVFKCGPASITLKKNGDVTIKGTNITISASASLEEKGATVTTTASGAHTLKGMPISLNP